MNELAQIFKEIETVSSKLNQATTEFEKALRPMNESLQLLSAKINLGPVQRIFNACRLVNEHRDILQFLRDDVSVKDVVSVLVKTPKEQCDDELLRLFGIPELEGFKEQQIAPLLPSFFNILLGLLQLWGYLMSFGITNLTFADFVSELLNTPTQTVQKAHENPSIPDFFNKDAKIIGTRDKKHKGCCK